MANLKNTISEIDSLGNLSFFARTPDECLQLLGTPDSKTKILHMNIRSVNKNFDTFLLLLSRLKFKPEVIVLSECWLSKVNNIPQIDDYVSYSSLTYVNQNDGVIVYVLDHIPHKIEYPPFTDGNCILCKIDPDLAIVALYRSPSITVIDTFLNNLSNTLKSYASHKNIIVTGDINLDIYPSKLENREEQYLNLIASHGLLPTYTLPTHGKTCLDHMLLKSTHKSVTVVLESSVTDHSPALLALDSNCSTQKPYKTQIKIDIPALTEEIQATDFSNIMSLQDANVATDLLVSGLSNAIRAHSSTVKVTRKNIIIISPG